MSRHSRSRSQRASQREEEDSGSENEEPLSGELKEYSTNMVKLLLNYSVTRLPIKRQEINKLVFNGVTSQKQFSDVFKNARKLLKDVYGLNVVEYESELKSSAKVYIIYSNFICGSTLLEMNPEMRQETTLLFLVLSYIFMKDCEVPENVLFDFLAKLNIDTAEPHPYFGDVTKAIRETFPKMLYLKRLKVEIEGLNEFKIFYKWGFRAEVEFDKKVMLQSVSSIMKRVPISFINQYNTAYGSKEANIEANSVLLDSDEDM
ncbi:unnamed protein product [Diamesa hyperborea]